MPLKLFADGGAHQKSLDIVKKNAFGASAKTGQVSCTFRLDPPLPGYEGAVFKQPDFSVYILCGKQLPLNLQKPRKHFWFPPEFQTMNHMHEIWILQLLG